MAFAQHGKALKGLKLSTGGDRTPSISGCSIPSGQAAVKAYVMQIKFCFIEDIKNC
jgi:hypothetical protein